MIIQGGKFCSRVKHHEFFSVKLLLQRSATFSQLIVLYSGVSQEGREQYELAATSEQGGKKSKGKKEKDKDMDELKKEVDLVRQLCLSLCKKTSHDNWQSLCFFVRPELISLPANLDSLRMITS